MSQIFKYDPSKITVSFGGLKFDGYGLRVEEVRRSPWRVMLDLRFAELVYRDACEAGTRTADEVTRLLAICNDLRDELAVDVREDSHFADVELSLDRRKLSAPTTRAEDIAWSDLGASAWVARQIKRRVWRFLAETPMVRPSQLVEEVRRQLTATGHHVDDVQIVAQYHDEIEVRYTARRPIQTVTIRGHVEIG